MPVASACLKCGQTFSVPPSRARTAMYCSKSCAGNGRRARRPVEDRFWSKVNKDGPIVRPELVPCHVWTGRTDAEGYGRFDPDNEHKNVSAHRFSYSLKIGGPVPEDVDVLHVCDNPPCVRWEHLFPGDALINLQDAVTKNRTAHSERSHTAKLTEADVLSIRARHVAGESQVFLADAFQISPSAIHAIVTGKNWRRTEGPLLATRQQRGGPVKLTPELVEYIRQSPLSDISLGRELNVGRMTIHNVRTGRTWKDHP
jgi:hypothetical protein